MLKDKITMLILSCDAFSDLWEGHIKLLEKNWPDRDMVTMIVTDAKTDRQFENVQIISAGAEAEWSERLKFALEKVETPYLLITLDDYFLIEKVSNESIEKLVTFMEEQSYDYVRLFPRPKRSTREKIDGYQKIFRVDGSTPYSVNLYTSLWKKEFLLSAISKKLNAWEFEVSLPRAAVAYGAKCAVSKNKEFVILDVVRKGKILHTANSYFKRHPGIYNGNRELQSWSYEIKLWVKTMAGRHIHGKLRRLIKKILKKRGYKFFSDGFESPRNEEKQ